MRPNLSYLSLSGTLRDRVEPPGDWHKASLRHLAVRGDGLVAVACQWQGDLAACPPLLATHRMGQELRFHAAGDGLERDMLGYAGSIALSGDEAEIAVTGPRGGLAVLFDAEGTRRRVLREPDICGVAGTRAGLSFTTGRGRFLTGGGVRRHSLNWDNHLIPCG